MRQLLITLVKVLSRNPDANAVGSIRDAAIGKLLTIIILGEDRFSSVKPTMQALEHFISKQIIDLPDFLQRIIQVRPAENPPKRAYPVPTPTSHLGECQILRDASMQPHVSGSLESQSPRLSSETSAIQSFVWRVLDCVRITTDLAPAAGRLLSSFLMSLQRTVLEEEQNYNKPDAWIRPIYGFMKQHPHLIELFVHHLLPDLMRLSSFTSAELLKLLPLDDLQRGCTSRLDVVDIRVFLLASKAKEEVGLMPYKCAYLLQKPYYRAMHIQKRL